MSKPDPRKTRILDNHTGTIYQSTSETVKKTGVGRTTLYSLLRRKIRFERYDPDLDGENWKVHPVLGVKISDLGRVWSTYGKTFGHDYNGYMIVGLGTKPYRTYRVHRLVAETWLDKSCETKIHVDHLKNENGFADKHDNRACMLEWVTPGENNRRRRAK